MIYGEFDGNKYYSLLELLDKLGKDGVAQLVFKGKPHRVNHGDMIYFSKEDVDRILAESILNDLERFGLVLNKELDEAPSLLSEFIFHQSLIKRYKVGHDEMLYEDKVLDMREAVVYGRTEGDPEDVAHLQTCGVISATHGKLYLDNDDNLLYENIGSNKSKIRGPKDDKYTALEAEEIGVLVPADMFRDLLINPQPVTISIKVGFQVKPHFILRINVTKE